MHKNHSEIQNESKIRRRYSILMLVMVIILFAVVILSFWVGYYPLSPVQVIVEFADKDDLAPLSAINESEHAWCTGDVNDIPEDEDGIYRIKADYGGNGTYYPQLGLHRMTGGMDEFYIEKDNPLSARVQHDNSTVYRRDDWCAEVTTSIVMSVDTEYYYIETEVEAKENGEIVHSVHRHYKYVR